MENKQIDYMARILCSDYPDGCKHCCMSGPESEYFCTLEEDCQKLYDAGFRMISEKATDVAPVVHAKWTLNSDGSGKCSNCNFTQYAVWDYDNMQNYCGHCGAKMDKEEN